jgi:hypothetical protein
MRGVEGRGKKRTHPGLPPSLRSFGGQVGHPSREGRKRGLRAETTPVAWQA